MQLQSLHALPEYTPHAFKNDPFTTSFSPSMESGSTVDAGTIQRIIQQAFHSPQPLVQQIKPIDGRHLHQIHYLRLSDGSQLILKSSYRTTTSLRHERDALETDAKALAILGNRGIPLVPRLVKYDLSGATAGFAFSLSKFVGRSSLREVRHTLSSRDQARIDRQLGYLTYSIAEHKASSFGSLAAVAAGGGGKSWRLVFISLVESLMQDAEDLMLSLPYAHIRQHMNRLTPVLENVREPRLVVVDLGNPSSVLVDADSKELTGVVDFGSALWGDILMARDFEHPSLAFFEGYGSRPGSSSPEKIRKTLYACYRAMRVIVSSYCRNRADEAELQARRELTSALAKMVATEY